MHVACWMNTCKLSKIFAVLGQISDLWVKAYMEFRGSTRSHVQFDHVLSSVHNLQDFSTLILNLGETKQR